MMVLTDFVIGETFWTQSGAFRCTDIGTRVVVAVKLGPREVSRGESVDGELRIAKRIDDDPSWLNGPPYAVEETVFDESELLTCFRSEMEPRDERQKRSARPQTPEPTLCPSSPHLTFGDLEPGDHFIGFPLPGDDSGHGGYLGAHRLFVKTRAFAPPVYENSGVASSDGGLSVFPNTMHVIKVHVGSFDVLSNRSNPAVRHWRNSGVAWFWSGDREDFGSVILEAGQYVATTVRGTATFESLVDAKDFVEEHSS